MTAPLFLRRVYFRPEAKLKQGEFLATLPFIGDLDLEFDRPVTIFVYENGFWEVDCHRSHC